MNDSAKRIRARSRPRMPRSCAATCFCFRARPEPRCDNSRIITRERFHSKPCGGERRHCESSRVLRNARSCSSWCAIIRARPTPRQRKNGFVNSRPDSKHGARIARSRSFRRLALGTLWLFASAAPAFAVAAEGPPPVAAATASRDFPKRLAITVVAEEGLIGTFQQRVSSWFSDGTEVLVSVTSEVNEAQLLTSSPVEVRAWIVPLSTESALLTFSCVSPPAPPRHLVREVHLRSGLDEIGLERLASVVHSAFVALSQGVEGVEREQAERELGAVGVATGSFAPASPAAAPVAAAPPAALGQAPPVPPTRAEAPPPDRAATHAKE